MYAFDTLENRTVLLEVPPTLKQEILLGPIKRLEVVAHSIQTVFSKRQRMKEVRRESRNGLYQILYRKLPLALNLRAIDEKNQRLNSLNLVFNRRWHML